MFVLVLNVSHDIQTLVIDLYLSGNTNVLIVLNHSGDKNDLDTHSVFAHFKIPYQRLSYLIL